MNVALWIVQGLLAALFLFGGGAKLVMSADQMAGPVALPFWFLRFIGVAEVLGALGLVFPELLRIRPGLTPLAAGGLVIIMIGAAVVMWAGGMVAVALINVVVALLAAFVAYGRWQLAPYHDASRPSVLRRQLSTMRASRKEQTMSVLLVPAFYVAVERLAAWRRRGETDRAPNAGGRVHRSDTVTPSC